MDFRFQKVRVAGPVGWLEFNAPPVNAFGWDEFGEVQPALQQLLGDERVRVVVIASALEKNFGSGADLRTFDRFGAEEMREWVTLCHRLVGVLRTSDKPLLAAIHGTAVGGQLEIAWHCDVRFAAEDARLGQPEININFLPPIGGTQSLARLMGRSRAIKFLYDGELVSAAEAQALGLVDVVVPAAKLRAEVTKYAERLAAKPPEALAAIRRCITEGGAMTFEDGLAYERREVVRLAATPNFAEGVRAFLEKRPPEWR